MGILTLLKYSQHTILFIRDIIKTHKRLAVNLAHDIYGPNPSETQKHIIVLHGLLGSRKNWATVCGKLVPGTKACLISADARNHGESPHDDSNTYFDMVSDVIQLQRTLSIKQSHIIGHSMGGKTGMVLALTEPEKVQSLIIADVSPLTRSTNSRIMVRFPKLIQAMKSVNFQGANSGHKARNIAMKSIVANGFEKEGLSFILMSIGQRPDKSFGWKLNVKALEKAYKNIVKFPKQLIGKQYSGPTLFIGGGKSDFLRQSDEAGLKDIFPKAKVVIMNHVGHNVHIEDIATFLKIVLKFYSKHL